MAKISHRECHLIGPSNDDINRFVEEMNDFMKTKGIPEDYAVNIFKDAVACCGYMPLGVAVEITGPDSQPIKDLDQKIYSKIIEICERENLEYHECQPMEVVDSN